MKQIEDLEFTYIVASDLAARGIDIKGVSHVINYELPSDLDFYVHRGRTARAGSSGIAMTIYDLADEDALVQIEKMGVVFENKTIVHGEWRDADDRLKRQRRKKAPNEIEEKQNALSENRKPSNLDIKENDT